MSCFTAFLALVFFAIIATSAAKEFQVGDAVGWRIPAANESELYNVWASRRRFHVGDSLRFRYDIDSVVMVDKYGFFHCDSTRPIMYFNDGDTLVNLDTVGTFYFISGNYDRCDKGQKMGLNVTTLRTRSSSRPHLPPTIADAPYNPYLPISPSPSQITGSGFYADSGAVFAVSASVVAYLGAAAAMFLVYSS